MLKEGRDVIGRKLEARDGSVGKIKDLFFDDRSWSARYFVVDTGSWLDIHEVLVSPFSVSGYHAERDAIITTLTRRQVEESPPVLSDAPISRVYEERLHNHYGWPYYWGGTAFGGPGMYIYPPVGDLGLFGTSVPPPGETQADLEARRALDQRLDEANPHLKSMIDVRGYGIHAIDGDIGHVTDFLLDDSLRHLTHVVVDTRNWLPGKKVVLSTADIDRIDWGQSQVHVSLSREEVRNAMRKSDLEDQDVAKGTRSGDLSSGSEIL